MTTTAGAWGTATTINTGGGGESSSSSSMDEQPPRHGSRRRRSVTPPPMDVAHSADENQSAQRANALVNGGGATTHHVASMHDDDDLQFDYSSSTNTDTNTTTDAIPSRQSLEARVRDLETKLATVSRLLQQYHVVRSFSPSNSGGVRASSSSGATTVGTPPPPPRRKNMAATTIKATDKGDLFAPPKLLWTTTPIASRTPSDTDAFHFRNSPRDAAVIHEDDRTMIAAAAPSSSVPMRQDDDDDDDYDGPGDAAVVAPLLFSHTENSIQSDTDTVVASNANQTTTTGSDPTHHRPAGVPEDLLLLPHPILDPDSAADSDDDNDQKVPSSHPATVAVAGTATTMTNNSPTTTTMTTTTHTRNLSFSILYDQNEVAYNAARHESSSAPPNLTSLTPLERRWLQPRLLRFGGPDRWPQSSSAVDASSWAAAGMDAATTNGDEGSQNSSSSDGGSSKQDETMRHKWLDYLNSVQEATPDVDLQMQEFVRVPYQVEHLMHYGFWICTDCFLYMITILPIRAAWSATLLCLRLLPARHRPTSPALRFHRRHVYQLIQVMFLYILHGLLRTLSVGKLYHWIRGQAMIKLYVLIAIVEVFDRLLCSLGQDCLDSLYWNTVSRPRSARMAVSVAVVLGYVTIHTLFLFLHVETLNVAMNSADQALLTLLISGNFAEIKSTVFKKYNKAALFRVAAADICERFKLALFLGLVLLLNASQGLDEKQFWDYVSICWIVMLAEVLSDSIKHAYITKFNFLPAKVYPEYALLLAGDVTGMGHEDVNLDHSHAVVKRIGLAQMPLVSVLFRLLREAAKYAALNYEWWRRRSTVTLQLLGLLIWLGLVATKLALGKTLRRASIRKLRTAPEYSNTPMLKKQKTQ